MQDGVRKSQFRVVSLLSCNYSCLLITPSHASFLVALQRRLGAHRQTQERPAKDWVDYHLQIPGADKGWCTQVRDIPAGFVVARNLTIPSMIRFPSFIGVAIDKDAPKDAQIPAHRKTLP
jgi:hypothetical protein